MSFIGRTLRIAFEIIVVHLTPSNHIHYSYYTLLVLPELTSRNLKLIVGEDIFVREWCNGENDAG